MKQFYFAKSDAPKPGTLPIKKTTRPFLRIVPVVALLVALAAFSPISAQTVTTFDAPGAGTGAFQGTFPFNVSPSGAIVGFLRDAGDVRHGFIRSSNGDLHGL